MFAAAIWIAARLGWSAGVEKWLAVLAIEITLESSIAALFSFTGLNSRAAYWIVAALCALALPALRDTLIKQRWSWGIFFAPLVYLSFRPVEEIDSINYLHYLIEWMANRATPYTFATNYVAFWELSFLPTWMVTRMDWFFPLLALKAVVLVALGAWLAGVELGVSRTLLTFTVFGAITMRHYWYAYSGVPTLKNDALHGVGFLLLALVVMRAARTPLATTDLALLAFGAAFASVKYTGIFIAVIAIAAVIWLRRPSLHSLAATAAFLTLTSGHYYLNNLIRYSSPFYPFQINLAFLHLPGTADLSNTSILYSLRSPDLWRYLFLPPTGLSPAGLLFPLTLAAILPVALWQLCRADRSAVRSVYRWVAFLILCGWLLYFRSVYSASSYAGDLAFIRNNLNSIRYVDGVLALSEVFLVALLGRFTWLVWPLVGLNTASRIFDLYSKVALPPLWLAVALLAVAALFHFRLIAGLAALLLITPSLVDRNRLEWTTYWNDLKPALEQVRADGLADLAMPDGGYFAAHVVAAGNPVDPRVKALLPEDIDALPPTARPPYLAVMVTSGSEAAGDWQSRYESKLAAWGYITKKQGTYGALMQRADLADQMLR
jgi:hypothetical protein